MMHPLYKTVKAELSEEPATVAEIAESLSTDSDATHLALEDRRS